MSNEPLRNKSPLLLITLLVLVAAMLICGVVGFGIVVPAIQASREAARRSTAVNNLKRIGVSLHQYHATYGVPGLVNQKILGQFDTTAEVGTDPAFEKLANERSFTHSMAAPRQLRELLLAWEGAGLHYVIATYRYDEGQMSLTWKATMRIPEEYAVAAPMLLKKLESFGFKKTASLEATHLKEELKRLHDRQNPPQVVGLRRQSDTITEEVVADIMFGLVGSRQHKCEVEIHWAVHGLTEGTAPTFAQLLALRPDIQKPKLPDKDASLLEIVGNETVFRTGHSRRVKDTSTYAGFSGVFPLHVLEKLEPELKRLGFELQKTQTFDDRTRQYSWNRYTDNTYAYISTIKGKNQIRFRYKPPRRQSRATVKLDDLDFQRASDEQLLRRAHEIATRLSQSSWAHEPLGGWEMDYDAIWKTTGRHEQWMWASMDYDRRPPGRELHSILLRTRRGSETPKTVRAVDVMAKWCPADSGWGARFSLNTAVADGKLRGSIHFAHYPSGQEHSDKMLSFSGLMTSFHTTKEFGETHYQIGVRIPTTEWISVVAASPDSMRDIAVSWLDDLKAAVEENVISGEAVEHAFIIEQAGSTRTANAIVFTSAVPPPPEKPRQSVPSDRKLTEPEKQQIIREADDSIENQKKLLLENYKEMHASLVKAFPLAELLEVISPP